MTDNSLSIIISSCDSFSDLWDGHIRLLERYWADRQAAKTVLVTDKPTSKAYDNISILAAGERLEWSERLKAALDLVDTEYVFITLDDYFLIKQVDNQRINELIGIMQENSIDYIRLYKHPRRATKKQIAGYKGVHWVDTSQMYCVNMYAGIWKTEFARYCADCCLSAWEYEVALPEMAQSYHAVCAVDNNRDFEILDVVRKGKLLHKSARYFKRHPELYNGSIGVNKWSYEFRLLIQTVVSRHTPLWLHKRIKRVLRKFGFEFFTED